MSGQASTTALSGHKIKDIKVHIVQIRAKAVHSHATGDVSGVNSAVVEITTDGGITGWGEASPWPVFTGTTEAAAAALHVHWRPHLIGQDPVLVERHMANAEATVVGHTEAKAALESALLDITGKIYGMSVSELVGGRHRDRIPLSFTVANPNFDANLDEIDKVWEDGVRIFKIKTGFADHAFDLHRIETLKTRFGDAVNLRVDYNQGLSAHNALRQLRDLDGLGLDFIEQPVKMHEHAALAEITAALDTPVMADESVFTPRDAFHAAQLRMADIFALKVMKSGGIRRGLEVAAIARAVGIEVYGGCMFETGIAHAAGAHLLACVPDLLLGCEYYQTAYYLEDDILAVPFANRDGSVTVPSGPGLGIEIDRDQLMKYTVQTFS